MENDEMLDLEQTPSQTEEALELDNPHKDNQGNDPLDTIQDVDELRAEAKKFRAISSRAKKPEKKEEKPAEQAVSKPAETPDQGFLKKSDFELANQKKAIKMSTIVSETDSEEIKAIKEDLLENWDKVRAFYTPRRGKDTPEDIAEDIKDAYAIFYARNAKKEDKPDLTPLKAHSAMGTGTSPKGKTPTVNPPGFRLPSQPADWYKK
jgi:hypothetical protein